MRNLTPLLLAVLVLCACSQAFGFEGELRDVSGPSCSPNGTLIVFTMDGLGPSDSRDLWRVNTDGTGLVQLTATSGVNEEDPVYSPDGSYIAYGSSPANSVFVMSANGANAVRVSRSGRFAAAPAWQNDSIHLAIETSRTSSADILLIDRLGAEDRLLVASPTDNETDPSIAADGVWMAYAAQPVSDPNGVYPSHIWKRNIATKGTPTQLTTGDYTDQRPRFSPDGNRIVFQSNRDAANGHESSLYLVNSDGSGLTRIAVSGNAYDPTWTSDGTRIVFVLRENDSSAQNSVANIATVLPDGTGLTRVTQTVPAPEMTPDGGPTSDAITVRISCTLSDVTIRYTTDGSVPTESSPTYTGPIAIDNTATVMARAWKTGYLPSLVKDAEYEFMPAPPIPSPTAGTYTSTQAVTVTCSTSGAVIRYTMDGTYPTEASTLYTGPITLDHSLTLTVTAFKLNWTPTTDIAVYELKLPALTFAPDAGTYQGTQNVTIACAVGGATIRYTTDGTDPTESSTEYTGPVAISQSRTLKARAWKTGWTPSDIKSAEYVIQ